MANRWRKGQPNLTPKERAWYGITATLVDVETGELRTIHREGTTMEALERVIAWCDAHGPDWKIRTLSTPVSIHTDLRSRGGRHESDPARTERVLLGRVKRTDLLERLRADTRRGEDIAENQRRLGKRQP